MKIRGCALGLSRFNFGNCAKVSLSAGSFAPNKSFKPTPHRGSNSVLCATLHAIAAPLWVGLTLALGQIKRDDDMRVFISWSGERSKCVALLLKEWLSCVVQSVRPWVSSKDIDRGSLWFTEISQQLGETSVGIICLTQDNKEKPWIMFEAGALAKGLHSSRVCTLLIDLEPKDIADPLAQFNHTLPSKEGILSLLQTLNSASDSTLDDRVLQRAFDTYWPQFQKEFEKILVETKSTPSKPRKSEDLLGEILETTRGLSTRLRKLEDRGASTTEVRIPSKISDLMRASFKQKEDEERARRHEIFHRILKSENPLSDIDPEDLA